MEHNKIKIMHVGQMIGGLDVYIRNTVTCADKRFEYVIVHGIGDNNLPVIKNGRAVREYTIPLFRSLNIIRDFVALIQTIRIIKRESPDLIHCHSAKGGVIGRIAGFLTGTRTAYTPHAFSFLSTDSFIMRNVYLIVERLVKLDSYLLACSESEREIGVDVVHYKEDHAYVWANCVPDAIKVI